MLLTLVSNFIKFSILVIGATFKSVSLGSRVSIGETFHLQCVTPDSLPTPLVSWYKDGKQLLEGYKNGTVPLGFGLSSSLELSNFSPKDAGSYHCKAYNKLLDIQRKSSSIDVSVKGTTCFIKPFC